jgi:uncharacterized lipoprotein YehR (DUF1307 family)
MMKKMFVLLTSALTIFLLAACQQKTETGTDWLEGDWYGAEWEITFTIEEQDGRWLIKDGDTVIAQDASLSVEDNLYTLTDAKGIDYHFEKVSQTEATYQQVAPDGILGTTAPITLEKIED